MERDTTKHSPRVDDELQHEIQPLLQGSPAESRVEEGREQEAPGPGEPTATTRTSAERWWGLGHDEPTARRELSRHLGLHAWPGDRESLLEIARGNDAPEEAIDALSALPPGQRFATFYEAWEALGGEIEGVIGRPLRHGRTEG